MGLENVSMRVWMRLLDCPINSPIYYAAHVMLWKFNTGLETPCTLTEDRSGDGTACSGNGNKLQQAPVSREVEGECLHHPGSCPSTPVDIRTRPTSRDSYVYRIAPNCVFASFSSWTLKGRRPERSMFRLTAVQSAVAFCGERSSDGCRANPYTGSPYVP